MVKALPAGTTRSDQKGYIIIKVVDHPLWGTCWIRRNRLVLSEKLGRRLEPNEDAHHINEIKWDDDPDNLELKLHGQHSRDHRMGNIPWNKGKTQTAEHRAKIGEANRRRIWKEESRARISEFAKTRSDLKRDDFGRFYSEETLLSEQDHPY